jgi:hypothetical protein
MAGQSSAAECLFRVSTFGLLSDFGFRISDFISFSFLQGHIAAGDALQMPVFGAQQQGAVVIQ